MPKLRRRYEEDDMMMYRYVLRLDIDAVDHEREDRVLIDDSARRAYATAYIDPSAKYGERVVIIKLCEKILDKLAADMRGEGHE